jgi:phosphatidate cytidylyltransferase
MIYRLRWKISVAGSAGLACGIQRSMRPELRKRIFTALILASILLSAVALLPVPGLALLFGGVVALASWEWSRLAGMAAPAVRALYALCTVALIGFLYHYAQLGSAPLLPRVQPVLGLAGLWWAIALLWIKSYPASAVLWGTRAMLSLMGLLVLVPAWLAAVFLLSYVHGKWMLVFMVILVAGADIGAYFAGHRFGHTKLAPKVSPGKTWEGVVGGQLAVVSIAVLVHLALDLSRITLLAAVAIAVCGAAASVVGDLVESMVKRHRGVKDSGTLLPGHGGLLDRIDGLTAAAPVFCLGLILAGWLP